MENWLNIELNYKNHFSYGMYHSGFDLLHFLYLENLTDQAFSDVKISVQSTPNIFENAETSLDYLSPLGFRCLSCDFIRLDPMSFLSQKSPFDVHITVLVTAEKGSVIQSCDFSCKILPYYYYTGLGNMPETLAFFVTPDQGELQEFDFPSGFSDPIDFSHQLFDAIKEKRITYASEDYSGSNALPVRLSEQVIKDRFANAMELGLLFASCCERAGVKPILAFLGKGKVFAGVSLQKHAESILTLFTKNRKNFNDLYLIDCRYLAYGSELSFDQALQYTKNTLQLSDEKIVLIDVCAAREKHILSLPNRHFIDGGYFLNPEKSEPNSANFSDYYSLVQKYASDSRVSAILTGKKIPLHTQKISTPFQIDLDVNQNKIFNKILSNDFTLIRAQTGSGTSTLFSRVSSYVMKQGKSILYITDPEYHPNEFQNILSDCCDLSFVFQSSEQEKSFSKSDFKGLFSEHNDLFEQNDRLEKSLNEMDSFYTNLEGEKRIVSSFLFAADHYNQLRDANDTVIFSPEQIGMLSDEMVQKWFTAVNDMVKAYSEVGNINENPLRLVRQKKFSYEFKSKLIRQLEEVLRTIESISLLRDQIVPFFPSLDGFRSSGSFFAFQDLTRLFSEFSLIPETFFQEPQRIEDHFRTITKLVQAKNENTSILETVLISFQPSIFDLDAQDLFTRYQNLIGDKSLKAITQKHNILKAVKRYLKPNCDVENIEYILSRLRTYQKNTLLIQAEKEFVFHLLSVPLADIDDSWEALQFAADLCYQGYTLFQSNFSLDQLSDFVSDFRLAIESPGIREKLFHLRELSEEFLKVKRELESTLSNEIDYFYPHIVGRDQDYFALLYDELSALLAATDNLKSWCFWLTVREEAIRIGLKNLTLLVENGKILPEELKRGFLRAFFKSVCEYNFIAHPELVPDNFDFHMENEKISDLIKSISVLKKADLDSILSVQRFHAFSGWDRDQFTPIELLRDDPKRFSSVFPCVIADIKEAKELFSDHKHLFDYVLIEHRGKISMRDFLWVFSSSKHVAFAGSLSSTKREERLNFDLNMSVFDYLWNFTEEKYSLSAVYKSTASYVPFKSSYCEGIRSDLRCYSVPAVKYEMFSETVRLSASFDAEYPNANLPEAQYAVDYLIESKKFRPDKKIGVIAATAEQKMLTLRLLLQRLRQQGESEDFLKQANRYSVVSVHEPIGFYDEVIFSSTFAPDRSLHGSRLPYSFLMLGGNDPKLWMYRLISSAREKFVFLTSFGKEDLKFTPSVLPLTAAFSLLFDITSAPKMNVSYKRSAPLDGTSFVRRMALELQNKGFHTLLGVQSGRYYIDLAVQNEDGSFSLGILSDQSVMNQKANISAIEFANSQFYEKNGWHLFRLRSTNCFDSFDTELKRILDRLNPSDSTDPVKAFR